ncbi:hypothetical protein PF005_g3834 [Phytophthora fragariae]|uniref:Uncharacterized protein n=1 Tax=Phytophthora fragariae TaxID=53985 RepID=A0A6A3Z4Q2_9STRA|nr:hypothetical protein PF005_g3834 [Phytophthora fragariae]
MQLQHGLRTKDIGEMMRSEELCEIVEVVGDGGALVQVPSFDVVHGRGQLGLQ